MLAGKLPESPSRGAGYTSPLRASQQSIGAYKAAGTGYTSPRAEHDRQRSSQQHLTPRAGSPQPMRSPANFCAGPTAKLEHVAERFSAFYSDLEQEKQVRWQAQQQDSMEVLLPTTQQLLSTAQQHFLQDMQQSTVTAARTSLWQHHPVSLFLWLTCGLACVAALWFGCLQQRKIQESARFQTLMESIAKLEKSVEVRLSTPPAARCTMTQTWSCCADNATSPCPAFDYGHTDMQPTDSSMFIKLAHDVAQCYVLYYRQLLTFGVLMLPLPCRLRSSAAQMQTARYSHTLTQK